MPQLPPEIPLTDPSLPDWCDRWQQTLGWQPSSAQQAQFQELYTHILAGNRQLNLTRITEPTDFWEKHLWDSLRGIQPFLAQVSVNEMSEVQESEVQELTGSSPSTLHPSPFSLRPSLKKSPDSDRFRVIDIGTGAGFPGIPVAIARPDWQITLLDSTRKKVDFLVQLIADLALPNVTSIVDRAEQLGQSATHRARYDLALIRAVSATTVCAEYALPLLKVGGVAVLYRGHWQENEAAELGLAAELLGGVVKPVEAFVTPLSESDRHCVYLQKIAPTPAFYPRAIGIPAQQPLPNAE